MIITILVALAGGVITAIVQAYAYRVHQQETEEIVAKELRTMNARLAALEALGRKPH